MSGHDPVVAHTSAAPPPPDLGVPHPFRTSSAPLLPDPEPFGPSLARPAAILTRPSATPGATWILTSQHGLSNLRPYGGAVTWDNLCHWSEAFIPFVDAGAKPPPPPAALLVLPVFQRAKRPLVTRSRSPPSPPSFRPRAALRDGTAKRIGPISRVLLHQVQVLNRRGATACPVTLARRAPHVSSPPSHALALAGKRRGQEFLHCLEGRQDGLVRARGFASDSPADPTSTAHYPNRRRKSSTLGT